MDENILDKCLHILDTSKSDMDLLAALLVVTKVAKTDDCDAAKMRRIFKAVGLTFPVRLLRSKYIEEAQPLSGVYEGKNDKTPEGCPDHAYQSLAATILSCFFSVPDLLQTEDIPNLPAVLSPLLTIISTQRSPDTDSEQLVSDCYDCLFCLAPLPSVHPHLLKRGCLRPLCQAIANRYHGHERGLKLLLFLCRANSTDTWQYDQQALEIITDYLIKQIDLEQGEEKFTLLSHLGTVLLSARKKQLNALKQKLSLQQLRAVLFHLLQNRLSQCAREEVLQLGGVVLDRCGVSWLLELGPQDGPKCLLILVHLSCIEVRMTLESSDPSQIVSHMSLMASCYNLLETVISHMTSGPSMDLDAKQVSQLHSAMVGAFNAVIYFLNSVAETQLQLDQMPVVIASIRVLGSWMAEETSALKTEIVGLLPFLLKTSQATFEKCTQNTGEGDRVDHTGSPIVSFSTESTGAPASTGTTDSCKTTEVRETTDSKDSAKTTPGTGDVECLKSSGSPTETNTETSDSSDTTDIQKTTDTSTTSTTKATQETGSTTSTRQVDKPPQTSETTENMDITVSSDLTQDTEATPSSNNSTTDDKSTSDTPHPLSIPDLSQAYIQDSCVDIELLQFLMPGLCHLSAEDVARETLLSCGLPETLYGYLEYQWGRLQGREESVLGGKEPVVALTTACGVLLNIVVTEPEKVMREEVYSRVLAWTADKIKMLKRVSTEDTLLVYNLVVVSLMILRNRNGDSDLSEEEEQELLRGSVRLVRQAHGLTSTNRRRRLVYHHSWDDTGELWGLAVQVLCTSLPTFSLLPKVILSEKWVPTVCRLLLDAEEDSVSEVVRLTYEELLAGMAQHSRVGRKILLETEGAEIAKKYNMASLQTILEYL